MSGYNKGEENIMGRRFWNSWFNGKDEKYQEEDSGDSEVKDLSEEEILLLNVTESIPTNQWQLMTNLGKKMFYVENNVGTISLTSSIIKFVPTEPTDLTYETVRHSENTLDLYYSLTTNKAESYKKLMLHSLYEFQNRCLNPENVQLLPENKLKGRKPKKLA